MTHRKTIRTLERILEMSLIVLLMASCPTPHSKTADVPNAPSNVYVVRGVHELTVVWDAVSGADCYTVYWGMAQGIGITDTKVAEAGTSYKHSGLSGGAVYYYRVSALNKACEGPLSSEVFAMPTVTPQEAVADGIIRVPDELATIQNGLDAATSGTTVLVANGKYTENLKWPNVDGIILLSENGAYSTIIDGQGAGSVIIIDSDYTITGATRIDGFTITNGNLTQYIHSYYGNDYDGGGGVHLWCASPTITNNVITSNRTSFHGGGISASWDSDPVIENNTITSNTAGKDGGGIYCRNESHTVLENNVISNNFADGCGGGVFTSPTSDPLSMTGNDVSGNTDSSCPSLTECRNSCIYNQVAWPSGTSGGSGGGGTGTDACTSCIHSCSGISGCCTGVGCMCYDECTVSQCNKWYCPVSGGGCWCIG